MPHRDCDSETVYLTDVINKRYGEFKDTFFPKKRDNGAIDLVFGGVIGLVVGGAIGFVVGFCFGRL